MLGRSPLVLAGFRDATRLRGALCSRRFQIAPFFIVRALCSVFCCSMLVAVSPTTVSAQTGQVLFSDNAASKATSQRDDAGQRNSRILSFHQRNLGEELQLDSADSILLSEYQTQSFFSNYRGIYYLRYFRDWGGVLDEEDSENELMARRALLFQGMTTVSNLLKESGLKDTYRQTVRSIRAAKEMTTIRVAQTGRGKFDVSQGTNSPEPLIEFGVHTSVRHGIEPRLTIGDSVTLRYDLLSDEALLEFRRDF